MLFSVFLNKYAENLLFSAQTRLPDGMSDNLRTKQVNAVIEILGLKGIFRFVNIKQGLTK